MKFFRKLSSTGSNRSTRSNRSNRSNRSTASENITGPVLGRRSANGFTPEDRAAIRELASMMNANNRNRFWKTTKSRAKTTGKILGVGLAAPVVAPVVGLGLAGRAVGKGVGAGARVAGKGVYRAGGSVKKGVKRGWGTVSHGATNKILALKMWKARQEQQRALKKNVMGLDWEYYANPTKTSSVPAVRNATMVNWLRSKQRQEQERRERINQLSRKLENLQARRAAVRSPANPYTKRTTPFTPSSGNEMTRVGALPTKARLSNAELAGMLFKNKRNKAWYNSLRSGYISKSQLDKVANLNRAWAYVQRTKPASASTKWNKTMKLFTRK